MRLTIAFYCLALMLGGIYIVRGGFWVYLCIAAFMVAGTVMFAAMFHSFDPEPK